MTTIHTLLVTVHIAVGALALVLFWVPAAATKGSPLHVGAGKLYVVAMYVVSVTAFFASIIVLLDPIGIRRPGEIVNNENATELAARFRMFSLFLLMLSILVLASIRHGIAALRERTRPGSLAKPSHRLLLAILAVVAVAVGIIGLRYGQLLLILFSGLSVAGAWNMLRDTRKANWRRQELLVAHLGGLIGSGIGAYTAFFAFGGARLLGDFLVGQWQVVPWILPTIIGTVAIIRLSRTYERRPGVRSQSR